MNMKLKEILKRLKRIKFLYDDSEIYELQEEMKSLIEDLEYEVRNENVSNKD